jgi:osmotically-inducible protein OsmY
MTAISIRPLRLLAQCAAAAALCAGLAGCFPLAVVGAGTTAFMVSDRRAAETQVTDEMIERRASNRLNEKFDDKAHIDITSFNRTVLITGEVLDAGAKAEAERIVSGVPNVKAITNELQVSGLPSFAARSNDALLTAKVKTRFVDSKKFTANHVKVVSEGGAVYLLGLVTHAEADAAADIARTTGGVQRVVRAFEYISDEQARELDNQSPSPASKTATGESR